MSRHEDDAWNDAPDEPTLREADADADEFIDPLTVERGPCCNNGECGREDCPNAEEPRDTIKTPAPVCAGCGAPAGDLWCECLNREDDQ